jgi:protein involved in polysaccharide export with SLBB domain
MHGKMFGLESILRNGVVAITLLSLTGCLMLGTPSGPTCDLSSPPLDPPPPPPIELELEPDEGLDEARVVVDSGVVDPEKSKGIFSFLKRKKKHSEPEEPQDTESMTPLIVDEPGVDEPGVDEGPSEYLIHAMDSIYIEVFGEPDISRVYSVSVGGTIKHPLLNHVELAGKTLSEAEELITKLLKRDYLVDPRVSIRVEESTGRRITIMGEIVKPGSYRIPSDQKLTLLRVVAQAGGFTDIAASTRVRVIRNVEGDDETFKINVPDLIKSRDGKRDFLLQAGDIIMIPEAIF